MQTIFPVLRYEDPRAAIEWLVRVLGFVELFSVPPTGSHVRHAQLALGTNVVMLGSTRPDDGLTTPRVAGVSTQALCVYVADPDAQYERARSAGAEIVGAPADTDFGSREFSLRDPEGHLWVFGTYRPAVGP